MPIPDESYVEVEADMDKEDNRNIDWKFIGKQMIVTLLMPIAIYFIRF